MKEKIKIPKDADGLCFSVARPTWRRLPHRHDELEVNLVVAGRSSYLLGNLRIPLPVHTMIWLFPGQEHVLMDCSHDFSMWVLVSGRNWSAKRRRNPPVTSFDPPIREKSCVGRLRRGRRTCWPRFTKAVPTSPTTRNS